jgi:hypothetical protein
MTDKVIKLVDGRVKGEAARSAIAANNVQRPKTGPLGNPIPQTKLLVKAQLSSI